MTVVTSIALQNEELRQRVLAAGMQFDCGCGGLFNAEIAVVAEAPGDREVEQRLPLVGGSGRVLWDALRREAVTRTGVYVTNVVKRRLLSASDGVRDKKAAISGGELEHWRAILLDELRRLPNLRYIVALGGIALHALTGESGITQWRGNVIPVTIGDRPCHVLVAYNPAYIIREPKLDMTFKMDLHKLTRLRNGSYCPPELTEIINPTVAEAVDYIEHCRNSGVPVSYDIESIAQETACVGLACSNTEGMCINFRDQQGNRWSMEEELKVRLSLQSLLSDTTVQFVAQNGNFDAYWLAYKDRIRVHRNWFDTMLAHHVLYPPLPHNLGYIVSQYTDIPYFKDEGKTWRETGDIDQFWRYNVKDCIGTRTVVDPMIGELRAANLDTFFFNHVMKLQPHLTRMTVGGVKCDVALKERLTETLAIDVEARRQDFVAACRVATRNNSYDCNPLSPSAVGTLLFSDLRLVGRGTSTDAENRARMFTHPRTSEEARGVLHTLGQFKEQHKFFSTNVSSTVDDDARFRCEYKQTGVVSAPGRLSSSQTMWGSGQNLQNIPEAAKEMFICDDGYELNYFDASQIEARIVAYLANIQKWKEQFELARLNPGSYDAHCALASDMFKVPYDDVPRYDRDAHGKITIRFIAKRCRHGLNYRMGPDRLATAAGLSLSTADAAYKAYHRENPEIMAWWRDTIAEVKRTGMLFSPMGRRWLLMQRIDDDALDSIIAFKPQSAAGDKVAGVIALAEEDPRWPADARVLMNIHDALIWINRPTDGPLTRQIMKEYMEAPMIINGEALIIPAEFKVSHPGNDNVHRWSTLGKIA